MESWTIAEPSEGRFRLHINFGGTPFWCTFDFVLRPAQECDGVEISLAANADPLSLEWFPHLRLGMLRGLEAAHDKGREWVGGKVEITKIHTHPTDTTARGCERYGLEFVLIELPQRGIQVTVPPLK